MYGYYSVGYWIYAANEYSLFNERVDVILMQIKIRHLMMPY